MGTMTVIFAKATIRLVTESIETGITQFQSFSSYVFTGITLFTGFSQIYWINLGLARYDALLQIPVFYVVWTTQTFVNTKKGSYTLIYIL